MGSKYLTTYFIISYLSSFHCNFLFTELDAVLQPLGQRAAPFGPHVVETIDTSADESERTYKMKKVRGTDEVGRFLVTGATDAAGKPSHFYCRICRKDVSVLKQGP